MTAGWRDVPLPGLDAPDTGVNIAPICQGFIRTCRECSAPIVWAMTPDHQPMPVNPTADERGNVHLETVRGGLRATVVSRRDRAGHDELHLSHFATCSAAAKMRKPRKAR